MKHMHIFICFHIQLVSFFYSSFRIVPSINLTSRLTDGSLIESLVVFNIHLATDRTGPFHMRYNVHGLFYVQGKPDWPDGKALGW